MRANVILGYLIRLSAPLLLCGVALPQNLFPDAREVPLPEGILAYDGKSDPNAISQWEAIWALVFVRTIVAENGSSGSGESTLKYQFDLDDRTASALFQHVQSSFLKRDRLASAARDDICDSREQIVTREDLVRELGKIREARDDARAAAVAQVEGIVGFDAYKKIVAASDEVRSSMAVFDVDLPKLLSKEPLTAVAERTERLCSCSAGQSAPAR